MRRVAYADPPYPGQAARYAGARAHVNLPILIAYLREFDAWALSTSASALLEVWQLAPEARCAAWAKTFASNGFSRVRWSWEPVLFSSDRRGIMPGARSIVWDSLVSAPDVSEQWGEIAGKCGGAKPYAFTRWVLDLLDWREGDHFTDVFPGSGSVRDAVECERLELFA